MRWIVVALFLFCVSALPLSAADVSPEQLEFFEKEVRPVLAEHCYDCHSAEADKLKGGLFLDSKWGWETGGDSGPALVPGDLQASLLIDAVRRSEEKVDAMPPKSKLTETEIATLEKWVEMGAPDPRPKVEPKEGLVEAFDLEKRHQEHWCWRPIAHPTPPQVQMAAWPLSGLDHFILAKLEDAKLRPANQADKRTWIRRVYFDLIGLPPSPSQIDAFLSDASPTAHEKVVDELLASPHFGEKWARHWMDLVRYAETYGHEFDYPIPHASEYRDYLIRAFNAEVPYNQLVREHIAGDLLPQPRLNPEEQFNESVIGTGFWYFHEATHAPTDVLGNEADIIDNQLDVFGKTFLGLTVACARCHDHKFDAISTKDYYALSAYIQASARQEYPLDPGHKIAALTEDLAGMQATLSTQSRTLPAKLEFGSYFLAAASLLREAQTSSAEGDPWDGVVFEDFESGYEKWTAEGTAFGEGPAQGTFPRQQIVSGFFGKGLINSYNGSDRNIGSLQSQAFTIERPFINFLIGGGKHQTTCLELLVDGETVRHAAGINSERLDPASWDVRDLIGKKAELLVVDRKRGGWGHVNLDHIVFAEVPATNNTVITVGQTKVREMATAQGLDPVKLPSWVTLLTKAEPKPDTPEGFLAQWILDPKASQHTQGKIRGYQDQWTQFQEGAELMADFSEGLPEGWFTTGQAFHATGSESQVQLGPDVFATPGTVDSALLGQKQAGILRSPTFEIGKTNIHVRLKSNRITMRVVMDNYQMQLFHTLLFAGTIHKGGDTDTGGQFKWLSFGRQLDKYVGHKAYLEFIDDGDGYASIDQIWISDDPLPPEPSHPLVQSWLKDAPGTDEALAAKLDRQLQAALTNWSQQGATPGDSALLNWLVSKDLASLDNLHPELAANRKQALDLASQLPRPRFVTTMAQGTPEAAQVYIRGSHKNPGDSVPARFLEALGGEQGSRLTLAEEVVSPDNPLTSRVLVNRLWHHLFGQGIVPSLDDFGPMGQEPSHPELLDWLAQDFMEHGWSLKHSIRQIVLSQTYRQDSVPHSDLDEGVLAVTDPTNTLLHKIPVRRLPAEAIRDSILAVSGDLDPSLFGDSVPVHLTSYMSGRGKPKESGPLDGNGRRSIYGEIRRNFLPPFLLTFDMPQPFGPKGRRSVSNVPAQSLALLNDPFVLEQARIWAEQVAKDADPANSASTVTGMFETALGRPPSAEELEELTSFIQESGGSTEAWTSLAHVLFNTKEFIYLH